MIVSNKFDLDDRALRQIAQDGLGRRSGKASRKMVRVWLNALVASTLGTMHEPKVRRRVKPTADMPLEIAAAMGVPCVHCRRLFSEHGVQGRACPVSRMYSKPTKFKADANG